jgi:hypothetical protein
MTKEQSIEAIKKAREAHLDSMGKIENVLKGIHVENPTSVLKTQCAFGQWLYGKDFHVKELLGEQFYDKLEEEHAEWHKEYSRIYNLFFKDNKSIGFFSKLIGSQKFDSQTIDKGKLYYTELEVVTNHLMNALAASERRLVAMNESKFH